MKSISNLFKAGSVLCLFTLISAWQTAQAQTSFSDVVFAERNLGGPRLGITLVEPGSALAAKLQEHRIGTLLSQFGWHFEYQVVPDGGGPSFVIQLIPLVAGVEYGTLIPSGTLAMGVRFPEGYEFGMGPNVLVSDQGLTTALVMSVGKSYNYGGVSIPLNLVLTTNPDGLRFSFVFGYAIAKRAN
jgi:hypothetical protein